MSIEKETFAELAQRLESLFQRGVDAPLSEEAFNAWALRVFRMQFETNPVLRRYWEGRGARPEGVSVWQEVPPVPTLAFKRVDFLAGVPAEAVFLTSGTSRGRGERGRHPVPRLSLYRASALGNFSAHLLPEGNALPLVSLIPSPRAAPESSLSAMTEMVAEHVADEVFWVGEDAAERGVDVSAFLAAVERLSVQERPALLMGTAFAIVHLIEVLARRERTAVAHPGVGLSLHAPEDAQSAAPRLPEGSRLMVTGGFKGRSREVARSDMEERLQHILGIQPSHVVGEYGMTELLSQLYEAHLRDPAAPCGVYRPPPWLRVRALSPEDLSPRPDGEPGLLAFYDLANAGSVAAVLTEDVGRVEEDGVALLGRMPGAEPRGCSMALEHILASAEEAG
ncbi:MAG: acyl-protein synthetase [Gemmatimonadota bacterium]